MSTEANTHTEFSIRVKKSLEWVTRELLGEYGLYIDKREHYNPKTDSMAIDRIDIFNINIFNSIAIINSEEASSVSSLNIWLLEPYLKLNKQQKFLVFAYLGQQIMNNDNWDEIGFGHVDDLSQEDFLEVDYFFRNILKPEALTFVDYLNAYQRVFIADKTVRKNASKFPQIDKSSNDFKRPS